MVRPVPGWLIWSLVALQVLLVGLRLGIETLMFAQPQTAPIAARPSPADVPAEWSDLVIAIIAAITVLSFPAVGALIYARRPQHPVGCLFCTANLGWALNNFASSYATYGLIGKPGALPAAHALVWLYSWPGGLSICLITLLVMLFPDGCLPSRRWRPLAWLVVISTAVGAVASAFAPGPVDDTIGFRVNNPLGIDGPLGETLQRISQITMPLTAPLFIAAMLAPIVRLRCSQRLERQQLKWFTSSFALLACLTVLQAISYMHYGSFGVMPAWAQVINLIGILSAVLMPTAAGIAILHYRLYDIDIIIRRTLIYGSLTAVLALIYIGSVIILQTLLRPLVGADSGVLTVVSTLVIAGLFQPLRGRVQEAIDRRFYRRKYDAQRMLAAFSARLRDQTDVQALTTETVALVQETLQPAHVSLWLRDIRAARGDRDSA